MADIELVIKIDEEDFKIMKHNISANNPLCPLSQEEMVSKVANGMPLPKGHGNLKDVDSIFNEGFPKADINAEYEENIKKYPMWRTSITGFQSILKNAPTIVEADNEEEDLDNLDSMLEDLWNATVEDMRKE